MHDVVTLAAPRQVHLAGVIGTRLIASEAARLLAMDEGKLLGGYRHRPGSHPWIGEHVGKWLHAASLMVLNHHDPALTAKLSRVAKGLMETQEADGYLGTYEPGVRFSLKPERDWDVWSHKYCLIGLMAYYDTTGDPDALAVCRKAADLLIKTFGEGGILIQDAGTHMGMASTSVLEPIVQLYNHTGERKYLDFGKQIVASYDDPRASHLIADLNAHHAVDQAANGKAYEMLSNLVGLVELARATGDKSYLDPVLTAWNDIAAKRLYITGTGSAREHWTHDGVLPNNDSTGETCVTVTWMQLNLQLLRLTGNPKYADQVERSAYNHLLGAQKEDGDEWCYYMPLNGRRNPSAEITCCASSGPRGVALLLTYAYATRPDGVDVNLYGASTFSGPIQLRQESGFPFSPDVSLSVTGANKDAKLLRLRIPAWAQGAQASLNGRPVSGAAPGQYLTLKRQWRAGDKVQLHLPITPRVVVGTGNNKGLKAVMSGPLVYALAGDLAEKAALGTGKLTLSASGRVTVSGRTYSGRVKLTLRPFFEVGANHEPYRVWMHTPATLPHNTSLFAGARESQSRQGNVSASFADGDASSYVVTYNNQRAATDWFAVELDRPVEISRIIFNHGQCFHDGGWFDTSGAKPTVQIKRTATSDWVTVGTLQSYPMTDAVHAPDLKNGQAFELVIPRQKVIGIRVIGTPSHGDNPAQNFASCAELSAR